MKKTNKAIPVDCRVSKPTIVCLCGSTRFMEQFFNSGWEETMKGNIVLSVGVNLKMKTPDGGHVGEAMGEEVKIMLDELHKRKIDSRRGFNIKCWRVYRRINQKRIGICRKARKEN